MRFKYIGDGAFIPGVPARDIEDNEELTPEQLIAIEANAARDGGRIYQTVKPPKKGE